MNKQQFLQAIRCDGDKFRADKILIDTGKDKLRGNGVIRVSNGRFLIEVTLEDTVKAPGLPNGIHGRSDFWAISGIIEDEIRFLARGLPHGLSGRLGGETRVTLKFSTNQMQLVPAGTDCMTHREISEMLSGLNAQAQSPSTNAPDVESASQSRTDATSVQPSVHPEAGVVRVSFDAILPDFKLITQNSGTHIVETNSFLGERSRSTRDTFQGEVQEWYFGLIQKDRDLHVHLRSKPDYRSEGEAQDQRLFQAFLDALAFTHGQHAWPFHVEHRRDGKLVHDLVQLHKTVARTAHAPFSERLAFNATVGQLSWDYQGVLQTVYAFFRAESKLSRETAQLLYLCREAGSANVPYPITLLSLCNLLESLVQAIYAERVKPQKLSETAAFEAAKRQVCDELKLKVSQQTDPTGFERILRILTNAEATDARMKFESVIGYLGLKPEDEWKQLFKLWTGCRNPLTHRMAENDDSEQSVKNDMAAESNIAGAINCMVLKLMGYAGHVQRSTFEDKYVVI